MNETIGYIVGGGLKEGFYIRLTVPADNVQEGSFVVCDNGRYRYYGLVTDLLLGATDPRFADEQSARLQPAITQALLGKTLYTTLAMYPTLMLDRGPDDPAGFLDWQERVDKGLENPGPRPVKTVPAHYAAVRPAGEADVAEIFGKEGKGMFIVGHTIEQGYPVRLDLNRFVKRSSGIFGATGTGKSFLTRIMLAGLMRENVASALVFDMHNEYAFDDIATDEDKNVRGLKSLFDAKVQVAALGKGATVRGHLPDFTLELALSDFQTGDIHLLAEALNLTETAAVTLNALERSFQGRWFAEFMKLEPGATETYTTESGRTVTEPAANSVAAWARANNVHEKAAEGLHRKLKLIYDRPYVVERPATDAVTDIVDKLEHERHVILSFGEHDSELDYLLVSNILTRRIRQHWVKKTEERKTSGGPDPRPLIVAIEEAHKLLNPQLAGQTAFGTIARELRKYFVTLLVVDQRPSGIDDEVMSQLGTRITGWLGDEDDIRAVLTGLAGREQLRGMLARLQEKEEVLLLGWGVKMPIPVKSRRYDDAFYDEMRGRKSGTSNGRRKVEDINAELFG
ncbi:MAG: ATP-binding protein [Chloroflexi bacterium]|nr:ATP-binding protein [Chloroflexota bacterium]MCI0578808.1 ATP-binding protein [Chloroflexota bacterium]MCI0644702.1 ATP-binding protein [Chloroflexota bacterium]MCI0730400.1 ATP-binding protein [Chloroflexota bacterium]